MMKVIAAATVGLIAGVIGMIGLIYWQGTTTSHASDVGIPTGPAQTIPSQGGATSSGGPKPTNPGTGGSATSGKSLFASNGCASCHTFAPAGASGTVGPNLADAYKSAKADNNAPLDAYLYQSIADPNAYIVTGYSANIMPSTFGSSLSQSQIDDLVAFLASGQSGK
jgi:cytochrome c551/c552